MLVGSVVDDVALIDAASAGKLCTARTNIDVTFLVEDEVGPAEGAIVARRLVPHGHMGRDLAVNQPLELISAWNTGHPVSSTRFCPRPMISPSLTITAPNGPPQPFSTDSVASRVASSMNLRSICDHPCLRRALHRRRTCQDRVARTSLNCVSLI